MATIQCKQCGGTLELPEGVTAGECPYCGSYTTFPKLSDSQGEQLYNRAEQFRHNNDFDRAEQAYGQYIQASPQDPEGYWGLVLSRFGIEYVEDPATHERIPTCHRVQDSPVTSDPDYLQAVELAVGSDRDIYEREAKRIEEIQQGILAISAQEKPYDVFICYKESTDGGARTPDSVDAQEIYYQLTNTGYKVFFSRITLEGKLGTQYEPYIFAALNSAKVMLVIGSKKEYFEAVWVRNEWSRFIALKKKKPDKLIIPCFKGMNPYDLPPELSRFQAQDMSKIGFIQDLLHGIKKVVGKEGAKSGGSGSSSGSDKLANLLRRAKLFAETGDFDSAREYCEKYLDQDAENGYAYFYRLMAELKVASDEALVKVKDLTEQKSFKLAQRFADGELKAKLNSILKAQADARAEEERRQQEKKRRWEEAQKAAAEAERQRQEEEAAALERQREEERIRMEAQSRIELLGQCIKAELFLHGKSVLHEELVRCISAENDLAGSPDPDKEIQVKTASDTAMAQAGGVSGLERKVKHKKIMRWVIAVVIVSAALLITVKIVSCARDNARIEAELAAARNAAATFNWRDVVAHAKTTLSVDPGHAGAKALLDRAQYILSEFGKAETAMKASRWEEVLVHARNILEKAPDYSAVKALADRARIEIEFVSAKRAKGNSLWKEVHKHAENILSIDPQNVKAKELQALAGDFEQANVGDAWAQCKLAERYLSGNGVPKNEAEAEKWFLKAAEQGNAKLQCKLAERYLSGNGVPKNYTEAEKWFRKAAEQGYAEARYKLGEFYEYYYGMGVKRDKAEREKWYREALWYYRKAAEQGYAEAQYELGKWHLYGKKRDKAGAEEWFRKAIPGLRQAAEQGYGEAQYKLGECYYFGRGVTKDYKEAEKWFRKAIPGLRQAAEQGLALAQYKLGRCYYFGRGVEEDRAEAVKWYRKAAEQGLDMAQYSLGRCYYDGWGVEKDKAEAAKWYRKAAKQGDSLGQSELKKMHLSW